MGSIPHGATINLQGRSLSAPKPQVDHASIRPFQIGSPDDGHTNLVHFDEEDLSKASSSRTALNRVAGLTQQQLSNPNTFLSEAMAQQMILSTTVLIITSDTSAQNAVSDVGGRYGQHSLLDQEGYPPNGGPNADALRVTATFWIEKVRDQHGKEFDQLQYTQRVLLNFNELSWPHITVATLKGQ